MTPAAVGTAQGMSAPTARKWLGRFLAQGEAGLRDASSRPRLSPRAIAPERALAIVELRQRRLTQARIARSLGVSESTVSRVLTRAGLSRWRDLEPSAPSVRYEHRHPGDLVHLDTKKLGRIVRMGHRITGNPRDSVAGAGWEYLFVAVDAPHVRSPCCSTTRSATEWRTQTPAPIITSSDIESGSSRACTGGPPSSALSSIRPRSRDVFLRKAAAYFAKESL